MLGGCRSLHVCPPRGSTYIPPPSSPMRFHKCEGLGGGEMFGGGRGTKLSCWASSVAPGAKGMRGIAPIWRPGASQGQLWRAGFWGSPIRDPRPTLTPEQMRGGMNENLKFSLGRPHGRPRGATALHGRARGGLILRRSAPFDESPRFLNPLPHPWILSVLVSCFSIDSMTFPGDKMTWGFRA